MALKLDWKDGRFGDSEALMVHGFRLGVNFEGIERLPHGAPSWNVWVFGRRLVNRSVDKAAAQERAERCAVAWLKDALGVLECAEQPSPAQP